MRFFFFLTDNEKPLLVLCRKEKQFISSMLCVVAVQAILDSRETQVSLQC